jgi:hypothetical protein
MPNAMTAMGSSFTASASLGSQPGDLLVDATGTQGNAGGLSVGAGQTSHGSLGTGNLTTDSIIGASTKPGGGGSMTWNLGSTAPWGMVVADLAP